MQAEQERDQFFKLSLDMLGVVDFDGTIRQLNPAVERILGFRPSDVIDISREDAEGLGLENGETVRIKSKFGEAFLPVNITDNVRHGELFATFHDPEILLNNITSPRRDRYVQAPEYKVTAVRIEKLNGDQSAAADVR